jgi:hypothetical protein
MRLRPAEVDGALETGEPCASARRQSASGRSNFDLGIPVEKWIRRRVDRLDRRDVIHISPAIHPRRMPVDREDARP